MTTHVGTHDMTATCPNCGERNIPERETIRGTRSHAGMTKQTTITYFNCPCCDFSTWDATEWNWGPTERETDAAEDTFAHERDYDRRKYGH